MQHFNNYVIMPLAPCHYYSRLFLIVTFELVLQVVTLHSSDVVNACEFSDQVTWPKIRFGLCDFKRQQEGLESEAGRGFH